MVRARFVNDTTVIDVTSSSEVKKVELNLRERHDSLINRNLPNQHSMGAITGLESALEGLSSGVEDEELRAKSAEEALSDDITNHVDDKTNPHEVTKSQIGLGNVDNTSDLDKPVSSAMRAALALKQDELVSGDNIKTINGQSVLGSGNITIAASQGFNPNWTTNSTTLAFLQDVYADTSAAVGNSYLGALTCSDLPSGLHNAEAALEIMPSTTSAQKVIHVVLTSGTTAPYHWELSYYVLNGVVHNSGWLDFQTQLTAGTGIDITNNVISITLPALQSGDDVSNLVNDAGYLTSSALTGYATESWVTNQGYLTSSSLTGYATESWVTNQGYLTSSALTGYATQSWVTNQGYLTSSALNGYATQSWVTNQGYLTSSALNGYATQSWVTNQGYITGITSTDVTTALGYTPYNSSNPDSYQTSSEVAAAVAVETSARELADTGLQSQIDAIVSSSEVFDIVGTYAELQAYDISTVPVNDIIKVLVDSTHDNAATYYRCVENNNVKSWLYIGPEGAYYTKGESDSRYVPQTRTINGYDLSSNVTLTAGDVGALPSNTVIGNGTLTIQKNGGNVQTFSANQSGNAVANISVPTDTSDLTNGAGFITGISFGDVTTALGYIPYDSSNPGEYTSNVGTVTSVNNSQPDSLGNVTLSIPSDTSDLTNGANFVNSTDLATTLSNYALTSSLATVATSGSYRDLSNTPAITTNTGITYVGATSSASTSGTALGYGAKTTGTYGIAIGRGANSGANYAYQIGYGTSNTTSYSLSIAFGVAKTYILLDGNTGLIPDDRISTNIARTSAIPTDTSDLTNGAGYITGISSTDVTTALGFTPYDSSNPNGYTTNVGTVTSVNNTSPDSGGNVTLSIPSDTSDLTNGAGFITSSALADYVTRNTNQEITSEKTFIGQKRIIFKQSSSSDKLGFTLKDNSNNERGYLEYNPSNTVDGANVFTLGSYSTNSSYRSIVGFRYYDGGNSAAYNLLAPLAGNAKSTFSLTTTYKNFYQILGISNGTTTVTAANTGLINISTLLPAVNDATITITQGGTTKGSFTLNQSSGATIALDAGGGSSYTAGTNISIASDVISTSAAQVIIRRL